MLLSSGCSFTAGQYDEGKKYKRPYPILLKDLLNLKNVASFAMPGADNTFIIENLLYYLHTLQQYKLPEPKFITVQTSDFFRKLIFKRECSGRVVPNVPVFKPIRRNNYIKINNIGYEKKHNESSVEIQRKTHRKLRFLYSDYTQTTTKDGSESFYPEDSTLNEQKLKCLIQLNSLSTVCEKYNIPLCIINYYGFEDWVEDPLFTSLKTKLLIANPRHGLYNELCMLGFNRPDGYHFDMEAHHWQAETIKEFFKDNKQIMVSTTDAPNLEPTIIQDYTDEL